MIRFGPAGFQYKDWEGIVYPAAKPKGFDQLAYLAHYFDTIEINSTFYGPARPSTIDSWVRRVSHNPDFRFTAKLYQRFTHQRKTAWTQADVAEVRAGFDPLMASGKLGAVLLQFPWSFRRTDENREWLDDVVKTFADYPLVLEVRHSSWNVPAFFEALGDRGIGFVNIDQPLFHDSIKPSAVATSHVGYVRVHGRNFKDWFRENAGRDARYDYLYTADELEPWAERTRELAQEPETDDVFVVTNNHFRGKAVANALMLQQMVEGTKPGAPPQLLDEYGDVLSAYAEPEDALLTMLRDAPEPQPKPKPAAKPKSAPKPKSAAKPKSPARKKPA
ncbi:MAG TPA: DUF72 domain-containing protein [Longimicrobium sp.]|nr:DUF72 domain-containing protein [Longimicrobium sp.]